MTMISNRTRIGQALLIGAVACQAIAQNPVRQDLIDSALRARFDGKTRVGAISGTTEAYLSPIFPSSHAANLLQLRNGDLVCIWFSGSWEGESDVAIVFSRMKKGSSAWSKPQVVDHHIGESFQNPTIFQAPDNSLKIFHTTQIAKAGEAQAHVLETNSHDAGETWSTPQVLFDKNGAFTRHPLVILNDHVWLLPMTYVTSKGIGEGSETNYSVTELSRDAGKTWKECEIPDSFGKVQPTVIESNKGGLIAFFRSRAADWIYQSASADGCHWSIPEKTVLPNNNASVQAFRLHNGHIVIAFNNSQNTVRDGKRVSALRKPLTVALSEDDGSTWKYARDIETGRSGFGQAERSVKVPGREEYSYPSIYQTADGLIHVAYTFRRQTIKIVSFNEDWLRNGGTEGLYRGTEK